MKKVLGLAAIGFFVALAVVVGYRLSAESMAVIVGVVCGVVASIPLSGLILLISQRRREPQMTAMQRWEPYRDNPPVVVVQGGQPMRQQAMFPPAYQQPMFGRAPRDFRVVGGAWATESREGSYENGSALV